MRSDGSAVDHLDGAIVRGTDGVHQLVPHACLSPSIEAVVTGGARPIALGQVTPRRPGTQHPEDAVQHPPVVDAGRLAACWAAAARSCAIRSRSDYIGSCLV